MTLLKGSYTKRECMDAVKLQYPNANGFTRSNQCHYKCICYAEFDMIDWYWHKSGKWWSCLFEGNINTEKFPVSK